MLKTFSKMSLKQRVTVIAGLYAIYWSVSISYNLAKIGFF